MTEPYQQGKQIIDKLGGVVVVANVTGRTQRAVYEWRKTGVIPEDARPALVKYAIENNLPHHPIDYVAHLLKG